MFVYQELTIGDTPFELHANRQGGRSGAGSEELPLHRANQDCYSVHCVEQCTTLIVTDGCRGGSESTEAGFAESRNELGAIFGSEAVSFCVREAVATLGSAAVVTEDFWEQVAMSLCDRLHSLATLMFGPLPQYDERWETWVKDHFFFTVWAAVLTGDQLVVVSAGDGVYALNGTVHELRYEDNAPPYLAKRLLSDAAGFEVRAVVPVEAVESLYLGTDGTFDLLKGQESLVPGTSQALGSLSQLWSDDRFFADGPYGAGWLRGLCASHRAPNQPPANPILLDDLAYIALRRLKGGGHE